MDFIQAQLARIRQQLAGLSASQRMLVGALVVIMVMTLFWWANYAGKAEMEALLNTSMSPEESANIINQLSLRGISAKLTGDKVVVSADQKMEAIAQLGYLQLLPRDTKNAFDDLMAKSSPFDTPRKESAMFNQLRQQVLADVIRRWPRVAQAVVLIDDKRQRGPGGVEPSASVNISMKQGEAPSEQLANAAARWVAGSVADLKPERVEVIIDGVRHPVRGQEEIDGWGAGQQWLQYVQLSERHYVGKVQKLFPFVNDLMVQVSVKPNLTRRQLEEHKLSPKEFILKPVVEQSGTEESKSNSRASGENGVSANAPLTAGDAVPGDSTTTSTETTRNENVFDHAHADIKTFDPGGDTQVTSASVLVPRSYFIRAWKQKTKSTDDPQEDALVSFTKEELRRMRDWVANALGMGSDDTKLTMDWYMDVMPMTSAAPQMASSGVPLMLTDHFKEIAIGGLALLSLFMVSNIVRKSTPAAALVTAEPSKPAQVLHGPEEAIGEAMEGTPALDGVELDEDSARAQQILTQVSDLVGTNPDGAAALVKRWLNRT